MPWCLIIDGPGGRRRIPLVAYGAVLLGSAPDCQIQVDQPTVSRHHLTLQVVDQCLQIIDIGSRNGSFLGARRLVVNAIEVIDQPTTIRVGEVDLLVTPIIADDATPYTVMTEPETVPSTTRIGATLATGSGDRFFRRELVDLLHYALTRPGEQAMLLAYAQACVRTLPLSRLQLSNSDDGLLLDWHQPGVADQGAALELVYGRQRWLLAAEVLPTPERVRHLAELGAALAALADTEPMAPLLSPQATLPITSLDPHMQRIFRRAARVASSDIHVLIRGESGTGKELLARHIHESSSRHAKPFVAINCAAFSEEMLEAELFGVEKGAATGVVARAGVFERASGGTLLLDEIGDMTPAMQARMLRVLQEHEVLRVGGHGPIAVDVRVISATHCDLDQMLADGRFRLDLIHRIADWEVRLPPLRERPVDIVPLAVTFLLAATRPRGIKVRGLSRAAADALLTYDWPGNVRELQREMARVAVFLDQDSLVMSADLGHHIRSRRRDGGVGNLQQQLDHAERQIIAQALCAADQQVSVAAQRLGVSRSTLYRRLRDLDLLPEGAETKDAASD